MFTDTAGHRPVWGLAAFLFGVLALVVVTLPISGTFVEPEKSTAASIGEFAAEIRQSAQRALSNDPAPAPAPPPSAWDIHMTFLIAVPVLAALATILGAIGLFRREIPTLSSIAIAMGCGAFLMQYVFWLALLIGGFFVLVAMLKNLDGIIGD